MQDILLTVLLILQIIVLLYILYVTYQRHKADKKFWEKQDQISEEFFKQAQRLCDNDCATCECDTNENEK